MAYSGISIYRCQALAAFLASPIAQDSQEHIRLTAPQKDQARISREAYSHSISEAVDAISRVVVASQSEADQTARSSAVNLGRIM